VLDPKVAAIIELDLDWRVEGAAYFHVLNILQPDIKQVL
jgi:hypothetical protein